MYRGQAAEEQVFNYIKNNIDSKASLFGGMDSTSPDIVLSDGSIVEVKDLPAQCGQFTISTKDNYEFSDEIIAAFEDGKPNSELCEKWVKDYYLKKKKVKYFGIVSNKKTKFLTAGDFFHSCSFSCVCRAKKSGSSTSTPKWVEKFLPQEIEYTKEGKYLVVKNNKFYNTSYLGQDTKGNQKMIYIDDCGRIKVLSNTANKTYIFSVKESPNE